MVKTEKTWTGGWYTVTASGACRVTAEVKGEEVVLADLPEGGQVSFQAPGAEVSVETDGGYAVLPSKAPSAGGVGGRGDGYIESNLHVGHGAADAVAAQCTLTLGDLGTGGTLADSNGQSVELEAPHKYAEGGAAFSDAAEAGTLTIGEWSKTWEEKKDSKASGVFSIMGDVDTISVTNGEDEYSVQVPANYDTSVDDWTAAFAAAGCGIVCTAVEAHGETEVSVEAAEAGEAGNSIVISVENYEPVTLDGGSTARTARDVYNDILEDADCPVDVTLDADEQGLGFTAREYGVNDAISAEGDMFSNWSGMGGGHGDYTVAELVTAIGGGFDDITAAAGEAEGTITLTANTAGAAANAITYTATGCFGGGTVKQGSTTRGRNAVEQTDYEIILNGGATQPLDLASTEPLKNGHVYTLAVAAATDLSALSVKAFATCELWLDYSAGSVTWPTLWSWVDGIVPTFVANNRYFVHVWSDGVAVIAELKYSYVNV